jgi:hypothetical protein
MVLDALGFEPANSSSFGMPVQTLNDLIAIALDQVIDKQMRLVEDVGALYRFDAQSTQAHDGQDYLKPTELLSESPGRWILTIAQLNPEDQAELSRLVQINLDVNEPTGFVDRTKCTISFDNATRTATIAPNPTEYSFYLKGTKYTRTVPESIQIGDVSGQWFVYFNESGILTATQSAWNITKQVPICEITWNTTLQRAVIVGEERHGCSMDSATHSYLHTTQGCKYVNGLALGNFTLTGTGNSNSDYRFSISNGRIADEDLYHSIVHAASPVNPFEQVLSPVASLRCLHRYGLSEWEDMPASAEPLVVGTRLKYNSKDGGGNYWGMTDASADGKFIAYWVIATNDLRSPILLMSGQREDNTLDEARSNCSFSSLDFGVMPFLEFRTLYRLIFETSSTYTNLAKARLVDVTDLRSVSHVSIAAIATADHGTLSGLLDDAHPQYMHVSESRSITAVHTLNPSSPGAPLILGPNAQGQKVSGFNADQLDGKSAEDFVQVTTLGANGGVATLGADGKMLPGQLLTLANSMPAYYEPVGNVLTSIVSGTYVFALSTNGTRNAYLNTAGVVPSNTTGFIMPRNALIRGAVIQSSKALNDPAEFQLRTDVGGTILTLTLNAGLNHLEIPNLSVPLDMHHALSVYLAASSNVANPLIVLEISWRN